DADREAEDARLVLRWIARGGRTEFKRHELFKDLQSQSRFPRVEDLDTPLQRLVKHEDLRVRVSQREATAGRLAHPVYEVKPLWDRRDNRENRTNERQPGEDDPAEGHFPGYPDFPGDPQE